MVFVREASKNDLQEIVKLWKEFMDFHKEKDPFFERSKDGHTNFKKFLEKNLRNSEWLILVAEEKSEIVGYCSAAIMKYPRVLKTREYGYIQDLAVGVDYRRMGVGKMLYVRVKNWFKQNKISRIELDVASGNEAAQKFWRKLKFKDFTEKLVKDIS
jgi:ribosomal protein S18 acetylase RimI-like enzyme